MYSNILVAIDGSRVSDAALDHAVRLARDQHARLHVIHVVDIMGMPWADIANVSPMDMLRLYRQQGEAILGRAMALAKHAGLKATSTLLETEIVGTRVAEMLAHQAEAVSADLVVLGSHGHRGLSRLFLGSVAEGTARLCGSPVLIVHRVRLGANEPAPADNQTTA
ncbi:putative universal stress protein [mine drainage metagenome]|uniref:Putative universal stress protein n=1 Tax=mine drainage metagenome TaxID=410659 RepID=A0A1J5RIE8_9ZZZZ